MLANSDKTNQEEALEEVVDHSKKNEESPKI